MEAVDQASTTVSTECFIPKWSPPWKAVISRLAWVGPRKYLINNQGKGGR